MKQFKNQHEGFALDWCPTNKGTLASGSVDGKIFLYEGKADLSDLTRQETPYTYHTESVEDIQFSPVDDYAMASCSVDRSVRITDFRVNNKKQAALSILKAHSSDVNVIHWNQYYPNLLASGSDDHSFKVWDLRYVKKNTPLTDIMWHAGAITSLSF